MDGYRYNYSFYCDGDVSPSRFVKPSGTNDFHVFQAVAGDPTIGISQPGSQLAPLSVNDSLAGRVGGPGIQVFGPTDTCSLTIGVGGCKFGDYLKSDATGRGVVGGDGEPCGAQALESAAVGEQCRVVVLFNGRGNGIAVSTPLVASATLVPAQAGRVIQAGAVDLVLTLPLATAGLKYTFVVLLPSTTTGLTVAVNAADKMYGNGFTSALSKGAINTAATDREGDSITVEGVAGGWYITNVTGTWARVA